MDSSLENEQPNHCNHYLKTQSTSIENSKPVDQEHPSIVMLSDYQPFSKTETVIHYESPL